MNKNKLALYRKYKGNLTGNIIVKNTDYYQKFFLLIRSSLKRSTWRNRRRTWYAKRFQFKQKRRRYLRKPLNFIAVFADPKDFMTRRKHFQFKRESKSLFNFYLKNKIKARIFYGITNSKLKILKKKYKEKVLEYLESTLIMILFRTNLFRSLAEVKQAIKHDKVLVNNNRINEPYYVLRTMDSITFCDFNFLKFLRQRFKNRLKINSIYKNVPPYIFINYKTMNIVVIESPKTKNIFYPFSLKKRNNYKHEY